MLFIKEEKLNHLYLPKNAIYTHEFYPLIPPITFARATPRHEVAKKLNLQIQLFDTTIFSWSISSNVNLNLKYPHKSKTVHWKKVLESIKKNIQFLLSNFEKKIDTLQEISSSEVQELTNSKTGIKGWSVSLSNIK